MLKILLFLGVIAYVFRNVLFKPIPGSSRDQNIKSKNENIEYTDYEEVD